MIKHREDVREFNIEQLRAIVSGLNYNVLDANNEVYSTKRAVVGERRYQALVNKAAELEHARDVVIEELRSRPDYAPLRGWGR
jgi:hypothetical protein